MLQNLICMLNLFNSFQILKIIYESLQLFCEDFLFDMIIVISMRFFITNFEYRNLKTSIMITKHPIYQDFPEYADKIKNLYHNNDEFQVLLHSYTDLDEKIYKIETDEELAMNDELSHLRKNRVFLKDEIFNFLKDS